MEEYNFLSEFKEMHQETKKIAKILKAKGENELAELLIERDRKLGYTLNKIWNVQLFNRRRF